MVKLKTFYSVTLLPLLVVLYSCQKNQPEVSAEIRIKAAGLNRKVAQEMLDLDQSYSTYTDLTLLGNNVDAYQAKRKVIRDATQSIDMAYFIVDEDPTSAQLVLELLAKVEKNKKLEVRILADYFMTQKQISTLRLLDEHPQISVKRYRPHTQALLNEFKKQSIDGTQFVLGLMANDQKQILASVASSPLVPQIKATIEQLKLKKDKIEPYAMMSVAQQFSVLAPLLKELYSFLHKLHHKLVLGDGRCFVMGGRNISDEYHATKGDVLLAQRSYPFQDTDLYGCTGSRAQQESFDRLWTSPYAVDLLSSVLTADGKTPVVQSLSVVKDSAKKATHVVKAKTSKAAVALGSVEARLLENLPEQKVNNITQAYIDRIKNAKTRIDLVSAYFCVSGKNRIAKLNELYKELKQSAARGVRVTVYTNSITSTDLNMVNLVAYEHYEDLMKSGIRIMELAPEQGSLHTKAGAFDDDFVLVGSYNLDPRSHIYDTNNLLELSDPEGKLKTAEKFRKARINAIQWKPADLNTIKYILETKKKELKLYKPLQELL